MCFRFLQYKQSKWQGAEGLVSGFRGFQVSSFRFQEVSEGFKFQVSEVSEGFKFQEVSSFRGRGESNAGVRALLV